MKSTTQKFINLLNAELKKDNILIKSSEPFVINERLYFEVEATHKDFVIIYKSKYIWKKCKKTKKTG